MKLAYLTSHYPAISHTFIMREILALRHAGITVETISQRTAPPDHIKTDDDRKERARTFYILPPRWGRLILAHLRVAFTRPLRYLAALGFAQKVRPGGAKAMLWHLFYFVESVLLWDELRRRGVSHVHVHFAGPCATLAMIASRIGDLDYSMTVHGSTVFFNTERALLRQKVERAKFVFCISDFTRAQVAHEVGPLHWDKLHIVHCGVDTELHCPQRDRTDDTPRNILCIARLVPAKGISLLLEALARLTADQPQLRITLVGDGPDRDRLERLTRELGIADRVSFIGAVGQDQLRGYLDDADLFVLPSFAEGVPVVLMEAMAHGVPVIGTAVGGTSELITPEVTGLLVPPGNVPMLADALSRLCSDRELRAKLIENGRRRVVEAFNIADIAQGVSALFHRLLAADAQSVSAKPTPKEATPVHARNT